MNYQLKEISPEEMIQVVENAKGDEEKYKVLSRAYSRIEIFPDTWAIDYDSGNYLFFAPMKASPHIRRHRYYMYFMNKYYEVETISRFGNFVKLNDSPADETLLIQLKENIRAAFDIYGRYGLGESSSQLKNAEFID